MSKAGGTSKVLAISKVPEISHRESQPFLTLSTCWYAYRSKFSTETYLSWIKNMLENVREFNLVVYTDIANMSSIAGFVGNNPRIKIVLLSIEDLHNYQHRQFWIDNHAKNSLMQDAGVDWEVNCLWSEKIHFVERTRKEGYFQTPWYGWCDIGYFRCNGEGSLLPESVRTWPVREKLQALKPDMIHYALVNNKPEYINDLVQRVANRGGNGLPNPPLPPDQISIAGGFFLIHSSMIEWYVSLYDSTLALYRQAKALVKDDQIIVATCVFSNPDKFMLYTESKTGVNPWFMFQRILSNGPQPKISILMPVYNGVEYLGESVSSVINQTYPHWELIIGVNGHDENSDVYQQALKYQRDNILVVDMNVHTGKSTALNFMKQLASNPWIALLDVDDIWERNKLASQVALTNSYDVIGTHCRYFGDLSGLPDIPVGDISNYDFLKINPIINSSCLVRKELCHWQEELCGVEDYDLWLTLKQAGKKFYNVPEPLVRHRVHQDSAYNTCNREAAIQLAEKYRKENENQKENND